MSCLHVYPAGAPLSVAELSAARIDGHLVEVGEAYIPADAVETVALRARTLRAAMEEGVVACGLTAAWIHGACDTAPLPVHLSRASTHRHGHASTRLVRYHDTVLPEQQMMPIGGILVTTPTRTLADLARSGTPDDHTAAHRMVAAGAACFRDAIELLHAAGGLPGKRVGLRWLSRADRHEVVTRYTS